MLEQTFSRVERLIPPDRVFTVVSRDHLRYPEARQQLSGRPDGTVVLQPENRETGPGILLPLMHLYKRYPEAVVAIFPSDHFIAQEEIFMAYVDLALWAVERHPSYLVLLGVEPDEPEPEYGYILPGTEVDHLSPLRLCQVARFVEKPDSETAQGLALRGGLWNTMVVAFKAKTLLDLIRKIAPVLYHHFKRIWEAIGTSAEPAVVEETYRSMEAVNFSTGMLELLSLKEPSRLLVLGVRGVVWSDWGSERRIVNVLRKPSCPERLQEISEDRIQFGEETYRKLLRGGFRGEKYAGPEGLQATVPLSLRVHRG